MEQSSVLYFTRFTSDFHAQEVEWTPEPIIKDLQLENSLQSPEINSHSSSSLSFASMFTLHVACIF
jgi:hypothetical protein